MLTMLIAYDADGNVVSTLDYMTVTNDDGDVIGLADFEAIEKAGGKLRDVWDVAGAIGSATWPEWIGARAHDFKVERSGSHVAALVHKASGHRRERAAVETAIAARITGAKGQPADIRDLVGGPDRPLLVDPEGRTEGRGSTVRPQLPVARTA